MSIQFRCPNPACEKHFTVNDDAAGRRGKCSACGTSLVVPAPAPAPAAGPEPPIKPAPRDDWDTGDGLDAPAAPPGPAVRFGAIGLACELFGKRPDLWVVAALVFFFCNLAANFGLGLLSIPLGVAEAMVVGDIPVKATGFFTMLLGFAVQGVLTAGLFRVALKQLDGRDVHVSDMFAVTGCALQAAAVEFLLFLGYFLGLLCLIVPGLVFLGVSMFVMPLVVDGHLGPFRALVVSCGALKRQPWKAFLFQLVTIGVVWSGALLCGVGVVLTFPLYILSVAAQYRRVFAPGAVPRVRVVEDPWGEAAGLPEAGRRERPVPGWAWTLSAVGLAAPTVLVVMGGIILKYMIDAAGGQFPDVRRPGMARVEPKTAARRPLPAFIPRTAPSPPPRFVPPPAPKPAPKPSIDSLETALAGLKDSDTRRQALHWLATAPPDDAHRAAVVRALKPALQDRDTFTAIDAAKLLVAWATAEDLPDLLDGLRSDNAGVRSQVIAALGRHGDARAAAPLAERLAVAPDRLAAANALIALGPKAEPEVRKYLDSRNPGTRAQAERVLKELGVTTPGTRRGVTARGSAAGTAVSGITRRPDPGDEPAGGFATSRGSPKAAATTEAEPTGAALGQSARTVADLTVTDLDVPGAQVLPCLLWSADRRSFFTAEKTGLVRRVTLDGFTEEVRLDTRAPCSWLSPSAEGLLLTVPGVQEVWLLDPDTLRVRGKVAAPSAERVVSSPASSLAFAVGDPRHDDTLSVLNLKTRTVVRQYGPRDFAGTHAGFKNLAVTPDGKFLFAEGMERLQRFRVRPDRVEYQQSSDRIAQNGKAVVISPDGYYVALPSGGGNYGEKPYSTRIYKTTDLSTPAIVIQSGAYPQALGFDMKAGLIYAQNYDHELIVFLPSGLKQKEYKLGANRGGSTRQFLVHPDGRKLLLLTDKALSFVELAP